MKYLVTALYLGVAALALTPTPASAVLQDFGVTTRDTSTGLEWLDLTETLGETHDSIVGGFGGFISSGFEIATLSQVCTLFSALGEALPNCTNSSAIFDSITQSNADFIVGLLGNTATAGNHESCGWFKSDTTDMVGLAAIGNEFCFGTSAAPGAKTLDPWETFSKTSSVVGAFLVKPFSTDVPEPSTLAIFGLGLAALGFMRRRRKLN